MKKESELHVEKDEEHLLLDHNYDGIQELNHPLPSWWSFLFYGLIFISGVYFFYYQFMGGPTLRDEFFKEYAVVMKAQNEANLANKTFKIERYKLINNTDGIKKGEEVYTNNCLPCHSENAKGDIGPNLTDKHWVLAKSTPETIYNVAFNGSEENGMPPWGEVLTPEEIYFAVAYVSSLKNSFQKGKAPQGEFIED